MSSLTFMKIFGMVQEILPIKKSPKTLERTTTLMRIMTLSWTKCSCPQKCYTLCTCYNPRNNVDTKVAHAKVDRVYRCLAGSGLDIDLGEEDVVCKEEELLSANGIATNMSRPLFEGNGHLGFGDGNVDVHWAQEE